MDFIRSFFSASKAHSSERAFLLGQEPFAIARTLIHVFYLFFLYYSLTRLTAWSQFQSFENLNPLWPVCWLRWVDPHWGARFIMVFAFLSAFMGAFFPKYCWVRIAVFFGFLEFLALKYSFGKIGHSTHLMLIVSFILIFLPRNWSEPRLPSRATRQTVLYVFWGVQAFILMTYTLAGLGKIGGAVYQFYLGQMHAFHPEALAYHIAERLLQTGNSSLLGAFFIEYPWLGFPAMLVMLYAQVFSFWVAFRPSLHRLWGGLLILFHISVSLTLSINFHPQVFLVGLFFLYSPFRRPVTLRYICVALPLFGFLFRSRS